MTTKEDETPEQPKVTIDADRRAFIRNTAIAAGAVAAVGAMSQKAEAQELNFDNPRGLLKASFEGGHQITRDHIFTAIEQMLDIAGCPTCGLVGFDLNLRVLPVERLTNVEIPTVFEYGF